MNFAELTELSLTALPITDDDWGSGRQITAENKFWVAAEEHFSFNPDDSKVAPGWWDHATTEEMIEFALQEILKHEGAA
jgi:hypothetical protein